MSSAVWRYAFLRQDKLLGVQLHPRSPLMQSNNCCTDCRISTLRLFPGRVRSPPVTCQVSRARPATPGSHRPSRVLLKSGQPLFGDGCDSVSSSLSARVAAVAAIDNLWTLAQVGEVRPVCMTAGTMEAPPKAEAEPAIKAPKVQGEQARPRMERRNFVFMCMKPGSTYSRSNASMKSLCRVGGHALRSATPQYVKPSRSLVAFRTNSDCHGWQPGRGQGFGTALCRGGLQCRGCRPPSRQVRVTRSARALTFCSKEVID